MLYRQQIQIAADARFSARPGLAIRKWTPVSIARIGVKLYVTQAAVGFMVGFAVPILHNMGVF